MQFLAEGISKAGSTDSDKVPKALLGLTVDTPIGKHDDPEKDHQAQSWPALRQDGQGSEVSVPDHEAGGVRGSDEVHGLTRA
jgi:hypothetical protein